MSAVDLGWALRDGDAVWLRGEVAGQQHIGVVTHPKHGEAALASPLR
jgi:hypothetical protein